MVQLPHFFPFIKVDWIWKSDYHQKFINSNKETINMASINQNSKINAINQQLANQGTCNESHIRTLKYSVGCDCVLFSALWP